MALTQKFDLRQKKIVSFGGRKNREGGKRREEEEEEEEGKKRRREIKQKGMELHGILKFCMNFNAWMVICCLQT